MVTKNAELGGVHIVAAPLQMRGQMDWRCGSTASQRQCLDALVPELVRMLKRLGDAMMPELERSCEFDVHSHMLDEFMAFCF
jgi:hypothetical protein